MADTRPDRMPDAGGHDDRRVSRALRGVIIDAVAEAQRRGAPAVEAEHLLLALSLDTTTPIARGLASVGLDHAGIERALRAERDAALEAAGVAPIPEDRLAAAPRPARPRWGASAREALVGAHRIAARTHRARTAEHDLLDALLRLQLGTVPRAIAIAGIDRQAIIDAAA